MKQFEVPSSISTNELFKLSRYIIHNIIELFSIDVFQCLEEKKNLLRQK